MFDVDRRRYLASHEALRVVLAAEAGLPAGAGFEVTAHGKPRLPAPTKVAFNLSHSGPWALIGVRDDGGDLGVDLESIRSIDDLDALAIENFTEPEMRELGALVDVDARLRAFLMGWTRKEACLKACGTGLTVPPRSIEVGLTREPRQVRLPMGSTQDVVIEVASIPLPEGMLGAVASVSI